MSIDLKITFLFIQDGWVYQLSASLDKAINISMGQSNAKVQHVYKVMKNNIELIRKKYDVSAVQAVKVSGVPMYGYHPRQHTFVKVTHFNFYFKGKHPIFFL